MHLLFATNNPDKGRELAAVLGDVPGLRILTLRDLDQVPPEPVEDGATLEENAWIKAKEIHDATGLPVIADDTGLEVTALGGAPGVYSARYAGAEASYEDNWRKLLDDLEGEDNRSARFRTVICYVDSYRTLFSEGEVIGEITIGPEGEQGFGYDPIFRPTDADTTFAGMSPDEKNRISHRARAVAAFRDMIIPLIRDEHDTLEQGESNGR